MWPRQEHGLLHAEVPSLKGERLATPQAGENLEPLVGARCAHSRIWVLTEGSKLLVCLGAKPDPDHEAPTGKHVERGGLTRKLPRPPPGQRADHDAQSDSARDGRDCGSADVGVGYRPTTFVVSDVVPDEYAVPA